MTIQQAAGSSSLSFAWGGPSFAYSVPMHPVPHAQGSSGVVTTVPLVWRGHTKSPTARSGPSHDLAMWLE